MSLAVEDLDQLIKTTQAAHTSAYARNADPHPVFLNSSSGS
jgi:hypothetical protein